MTKPPFKPEFIGDPERLLATSDLSLEEKIATLTEWREKLSEDAKVGMLGSGQAARLMDIERAMSKLQGEIDGLRAEM